MLYALKIAWRYLTSSRAQTGLLVAGVATGVFVFVFISALIGGLGNYLVLRTVGDISHVTLSAPPREAALLQPSDKESLLVVQREVGQRNILRNADAFLPALSKMAGVRAVSPQITGNGFVIRGQSRAAVTVTGVEPERVSAIADLQGRLVAGSTRISSDSVLIGKALAEDLGLRPGQILRLKSDRDQERALLVAGIFEAGVESLDRRSVFVTLSAARVLFDQPQGLSRVEIKLEDLYQAEAMASRIHALTGFEAKAWTESNAQLLGGLVAQQNSGNMIKGFALLTIVIGVASALLLSTYRRSPEIGIMRAFGAGRGFIIGVFVTQGALIGALGGIFGAGAAYALLSRFPVPASGAQTGFPVDYTQGDYLLAIGLTMAGAILASILPARAAAQIDPVKVIGQ